MRCPLCDGSVVNGRCKDCGMPYRNDEILYHLNESRRDHYQHASDKARKIMREQQRPQDTPTRCEECGRPDNCIQTGNSGPAEKDPSGCNAEDVCAAKYCRNDGEIHQKAEETFEICMGMDTFYSCDVTCTGIWRF